MTVVNVKYMNENNIESTAVFSYELEPIASLSVVSDEFAVTKEGTDIFDCFEKVRDELKTITFICFGAHEYCYPSGMCRSMGDGLLVYYHEMGARPDRSSIRKTFDNVSDPSECVALPQQQKEYLDKWFNSF